MSRKLFKDFMEFVYVILIIATIIGAVFGIFILQVWVFWWVGSWR
jgi:hypothetical protein